MTNLIDAHLRLVLEQMLTDQADTEVHYRVTASYIDKNGERVYYAPVHVHPTAITNLKLMPTGIYGELILRPRKTDERVPVHIPYEQIWQVARNDSEFFESKHTIYFNKPVMKAMFDYLINLPEDNQDHA